MYQTQGQEQDNEIKGDGNSVNYKYRMHDPRIGRFFAVDPLASKYPHYTPYSFSGNKVIAYVELEGLEKQIYHDIMLRATGKAKLKVHGSREFTDTKLYNNFVKEGALSGIRFMKNVVNPIVSVILRDYSGRTMSDASVAGNTYNDSYTFGKISDAFGVNGLTGHSWRSKYYGEDGFYDHGRPLLFGTWGSILSGGTLYAGTAGFTMFVEGVALSFSVDDMSTAFYEEHGSFLTKELRVDKEALADLKLVTSGVAFFTGVGNLMTEAMKNPNVSTDVLDVAGTVLNEINSIDGVKVKVEEHNESDNNSNLKNNGK